MVQSKTEGKHAGEFLISELRDVSDYNREVATLSSGQKLTDGTLLKLSGGELVAIAGTLNTANTDLVDTIVGILIGNWDSSATGTNADIPRVPYMARGPGVVHADRLTYPVDSSPVRAAVKKQLLALNVPILVRK